jgi:hypothetical protein
MNRIILHIITIVAFTATITSCSKKEAKKSGSPLASHIQSSPDYLAISSEKESLFQAAETLKPEEGAELETLACAQIKIYNVYAEKIPALIQKEREVTLGLIDSWGKTKAQNVTQEVGKVESDTLQELLATAIRANHAANERFVNFQLLAAKLTQMGEQAKLLSEEGSVEKLRAFQKKFNALGSLILEEREWLEAHPPLESEEAVIANFKQKHQASEYLEDAIHIYNLKYN